jgi:ATP-dependent DNA helicase RecQ
VTAPAAPERRARTGEIACDEALFEQLRRLRKQLADGQNVAAYIVFSDVSLRQMARNYPTSQEEFMHVSGVSERKLAEYGAPFLQEIAAYLQTYPRQIFADDSFTVPSTRRPF